MDKDPTKLETTINADRIKCIARAAIILANLKNKENSNVDSEPQNIGMYDPADKVDACNDERTISIDAGGKKIPVFVPIEHNIDANQRFYSGETTYFFNWQDYQPEFEDQIVEKLSQIPRNALIALERKADDNEAHVTLEKLINKYGNRQIELLPKCVDEQSDQIKNVIFYYSEIHRPDIKVDSYPNISSAFESLKDTDGWKSFESKGVRFASGEDIAPRLKEGKTTKLLEDLWVVYDETFNELVKDHPSDQKIPREYFDLLTTSPNSKVMYVEDDGQVVSALFIVEELTDLPWLNQAYYKELNPNGKTVFMPGIATKKDVKKAIAYSPRLIEAFSFIGQHLPGITALATQCTNVSARYIPRMTNRYTQGRLNVDMQEIAKYEYPVYRVI